MAINPKVKIMLKLQAYADGIFEPIAPRNPLYTKVHAARDMFHRCGLPWTPDKGSGAEAKEWERALGDLISKGVAMSGKGSVKTTHARLTPKGDELARDLTGWPGLEETLDFMRSLASRRDKYGDFIPEFELDEAFGFNWEGCQKMDADTYRTKVSAIIDKFLAAAVRNWAGSRCDTIGRRYYYLTPEGEDAAKSAKASKLPDVGIAEAGRMLMADYYIEKIREGKAAVTARPLAKPSEIWAIPLAAGTLNHGKFTN